VLFAWGYLDPGRLFSQYGLGEGEKAIQHGKSRGSAATQFSTFCHVHET
jgi:hypothetical protein